MLEFPVLRLKKLLYQEIIFISTFNIRYMNCYLNCNSGMNYGEKFSFAALQIAIRRIPRNFEVTAVIFTATAKDILLPSFRFFFHSLSSHRHSLFPRIFTTLDLASSNKIHLLRVFLRFVLRPGRKSCRKQTLCRSLYRTIVGQMLLNLEEERARFISSREFSRSLYFILVPFVFLFALWQIWGGEGKKKLDQF